MDGSLQALRETGSASTCVGRDRAVGHRADRRQNIAVTFIESGKWSGSHGELDAILQTLELSHLMLPIRDAIDFIHVCIYTTIKAMKFSVMSQTCGASWQR